MAGNRKRKSIGRLHGFKKGAPSVNTGKKFKYEDNSLQDKKFVRLKTDVYESRINDEDGLFTFKDVDGSETGVVPLRCQSESHTLLDEYSQPGSSDTLHPDSLTNKLYCPLFLNQMFNTEIKKHCIGNNACRGDLIIDTSTSRKWGLCWYEYLKCTKCRYRSKYYRLFEQSQSKARGRKSAKVNVGLQLGAMTTPIGNEGLARILTSSNITPPAKNSMRKQSNKLAEAMVTLNKQNMHDIRDNLKAENKTCGNKDPYLVNVEGDSCYNNPLFNADSTPFQAGTIVTTTMCENNTKKKQIIGVSVGNKLCRVAQLLRKKGEAVSCPGHKGHCSATLTETDSIGNESRWTRLVADEIRKDLTIAHYTGDGDSKGHSGVDSGQHKHVTHLKDIRHLSNSMRRQINKAPFSKVMFSGSNRSNLLNRFSMSVKSRCIAELNSAHKKYKGNTAAIKASLPEVMKTIVLCFKGYCGESCKTYSLVCTGNCRQAKSYMPPNFKLKMTKSDEQILWACMHVLLGPKNLELTKLQTSTQKCEAVNRSYVSCVPKSVTFSRNYSGRIHSQILKLNKGFANSTLMKMNYVGAPLTKGSSVIKTLIQHEKHLKRTKSQSYKLKAKASRYETRLRRYRLHAEVHYKKGMTDPKPDFSNILPLADHQYF